jgi:hypothetical protein
MASRLHTLAILAIAAAATLGTALAEDPGRAPPAEEKLNLKFQALDGNRDGMISKMEAHGDEDMEKQFPTLDRDADGDVSLTEFAAFEFVPPGRKREPGQLDDSAR